MREQSAFPPEPRLPKAIPSGSEPTLLLRLVIPLPFHKPTNASRPTRPPRDERLPLFRPEQVDARAVCTWPKRGNLTSDGV